MTKGAVKISDEVRDAIRSAGWGADSLNFGPPGSMDKKLYQAVVKVLTVLGIVWNRKRGVHVGSAQALAELRAALAGEGEVVDLDKKFDFHPTVFDVAEVMAEALVRGRGNNLGRLLEPSAGEGDLIKALAAVTSKTYISVTMIDVDPRRGATLRDLCISDEMADLLGEEREGFGHGSADHRSADYHIGDFLKWAWEAKEEGAGYDSILANPPFSRGTDVKHILAMLPLLAPGGRIVTLVSAGASMRKLKEALEAYNSPPKAQTYTLELSEEPVVAGVRTDAKSYIAVIDRAAR